MADYLAVMVLQFQSTPSPRRATLHQPVPKVDFFISIHALPAEGDVFFAQRLAVPAVFQSTPSPRRATP